MVLFKMQCNRTGIGHHRVAIHKDRDLTLTGETKHVDLAHAGGHLHDSKAQRFGLKDHPHLETKG
tara:strand:+ start:1074 stop:1268 length:195 start_codon:yes stop_codon:yes gene_type:complete